MKKRFARQSFLGPDSEATFACARIGVVGAGGGGMPIIQSLAHLGAGTIISVDDDIAEDSNLNRLIGATARDVRDKTAKVHIAERLVAAVNPQARVVPIKKKWQLAAEELRACHVIFGAVDSYRERAELERFTRRFLIPYVDIGMDVNRYEHGHVIGGQVILSSPGHPCFWCVGFLTDRRLEEEARTYGAAGDRPQVVWPNGVLAATAVGLFVQLITPWHGRSAAMAYLEYDGNTHTVQPSRRMLALSNRPCPHHPAEEVGDAFFGSAA